MVVPEPELEALRDLVRCREDLRGDLMACRHRITKLLLRRGLIYPGPGAAWTRRHASWLGSLAFTEPLVQLTFAEHLSCHEVLLTRRDRLDHLIAEQATTGPWAALIARLRCLRGVDTLTAIGLLTEVGDFTAFAHPRRLASFVGLTPSESSSGDRRRQGSITKCGSSHARRLLIEASWHYRRHPALSVDLRRRQANQPPAAIDAAWRAQLRLHRRWTHLDATRGKKRTTVAVAVARELARARLRAAGPRPFLERARRLPRLPSTWKDVMSRVEDRSKAGRPRTHPNPPTRPRTTTHGRWIHTDDRDV